MSASSKNLPIAKEGLPLILKFLVSGFLFILIPYAFFYFLGATFLIIAIFCTYFFRDPERKVLNEPNLILSPGDGKILEVSEEENKILGGKAKVVRIFLSIFDVHVQRSPISGVIRSIQYKKGKFLDARDLRAARENEQNTILIENENCKAAVSQIAGKIARKIHCWVHSGQKVSAGERLGMIRFGSQVDIFLPRELELCVSKGEQVYGGISVLAFSPHPLHPSSSEEDGKQKSPQYLSPWNSSEAGHR